MIRSLPYKRVKYDSLDGNTKVRIEKNEAFYIEASPTGMKLDIKHSIESQEDWKQFLTDFGKMIDAAQADWLSLKRKLTTTLSGH